MRPKVKRDWTAARQKVEDEGVCRHCGRRDGVDCRLEAAHVIGRTHDEQRPCEPCEGTGHDHDHAPCQTCNGHGYVLWVDPLDIVPLCGPRANQQSCHARYDDKKISILEDLWHDEQVRAVHTAGMAGTKSGIVLAYIRLTGSKVMPEQPVVADTSSVPW